ncbi:pre-mRNA-splicing factor CWC22 homolog [Littorina saxatilis]|uniref:MI domain-containing protein n=1 Tax=Littorina saxatilis TaxID=31220 RepID=A0AAN9BV28_9CAEN
MPRARKESSSDGSDGGSSSGEETSGSDSSGSDNSGQDHERAPKKDLSTRSKGSESTPVRSKRGGNSEEEDTQEQRRKVKGVSDSGELSSSDGEHVPRSGPRSTVVQKVSTPTKDKGRNQDETGKASPDDDSAKEKGKDKRDDADVSQSKKRSRSQSPKNRDGDKRFKDDRSHNRSSDRRDERRPRRDDRDADRDRNWRRDNDRRRNDDRRRDDDRRGDRSRRDDRRRDGDRRDDRRVERDGGDRRRDKDDRDKDRGDSRRDENKENKKDDNEPQKRKAGEPDGVKEGESAPPQKKSKDLEDIMTRTGGAYIPPAKLRMLQAQITDKSSVPYQRMAWEALKKSINGLINKVNVSNIIDIVREIFQENIVRGRGLLARSVTQAQAASPTFTHVYAALVAIINTKFPQVGELILQRLVLQFKRGFRRNDKNICLSSTRFVAHLVNQQVAHEVIALEILTLLLENATEDSVEVAISFLKECGQKLTEVSPKGINAIFERLRNILHEAQLDKRVQYMVEVMFAIRKDGFKAHPAVISDLDLVEEDDQFTHLLQLDDVTTGHEQLNVFKADDDYQENEEKYKTLKKEILDEGSSDEEGSGQESGSEESSDDEDDEEKETATQDIIDQTETNMVALRRTIYLTVQSSLDFEECAHKLLKMDLKPGQEVELCYMIVDCCAQLRTYEKFFGLLAGRFCSLDKKYVVPFETIFQEQFETIHRLDTNKLRNVAKLFAHLLHTDAISWSVMNCMKLTEEDTTSASRIFIKILFLELSEYMGLPKLNKRLRDPTLQEYFEGILPRSNPKHTRFAINFFTTIGLGGLTEDLREHLKGISKQLMQQKQQQEQQEHQQQQQQKPASSSSSDSSESDSSDSDSSDSSDSSSSESSDSDSDDSNSSSDSGDNRKKKKKRGQKAQKARDKPSRSKDNRKPNRHSEQPDRHRAEPERRMNGRGSDSRPRIEDKLLKLSLPQGMTLVDPTELSPPPPMGRKGKKGRDKGKRKLGRKKDRRGNKQAESGGRGRQNSNYELRGNSSFEQGSDRDHSDRAFYRGDRDNGPRGRPVSPPLSSGRKGRQQDGYDAMVDRRGGSRREPSPISRRDGPVDRQEDYPPRKADRREADLTPPPPPRGVDRYASPPARQDRRDYDSPPFPRRQDRLDVDVGGRRGYDRQDVDDLAPRQSDRRVVDSPPRYPNNREPDSPPPPRGGRRREALSPPPRVGRREVDSPPRRMDSPPPPRRAGRGDSDRGRDDLNRSVESPPRRMDRGRGDLDRPVERGRGDVERGRVDMDRGRGEVSRSIERSRDVERGRGDIDRAVDRGRGDVDREIERGRGDLDRGLDRRRGGGDMDMDRSLDRGGREDMDRGRGDFDRSMDRGKGDMDRGRVDNREDMERSSKGMDRGRGEMDRGRDKSGGRGNLDSPPRQDKRGMTRTPPVAGRRDLGHSDVMRDGDRRRGGGAEMDGRGSGGGRSLTPPPRKDKGRPRNEEDVRRRRSVSRDMEDRRKPSRNEREVSRERVREKRRR